MTWTNKNDTGNYETEDIKGSVLEELLNTRVYLLNRVEMLDSLLLEYITKNNICDTMDKENLQKFLRGCLGFHKSFTLIKGATGRVMKILGGDEDYGIVVSTTSPQKIKMKTNDWIEVSQYLKGLKDEDKEPCNK